MTAIIDKWNWFLWQWKSICGYCRRLYRLFHLHIGNTLNLKLSMSLAQQYD